MAAVNTTTTLAGLFKEVYGDSVIDLAKFLAKLSSRIGFSEADAIGQNFNLRSRIGIAKTLSMFIEGSAYKSSGKIVVQWAVDKRNPILV